MATGARADDLPRASPESLGFSAERLDYIDKFYSDKVKHNQMAGIVTLLARHGKVAHLSAGRPYGRNCARWSTAH
jgi:hypothetical protein